MNAPSRSLRIALAASCAASLSVSIDARAQQVAGIAKVVSVQGTVESQRGTDQQWVSVRLNDTFAAGDKIRVAQRSRADIALLDRSVLRLNENSSITIEPVKGQGTGVIDLLRGAVHFLSRGPESLVVNTPFTVAGVRGTEFLLEVDEEKTLLSTFEGTVVAENDQGSVTVTAGQSAVAEKGQPPVLRVVAHPRDAVQWALYYPPVLHFKADDFPAGSDWKGAMRRSIEAYERGDLTAGFVDVVDVPPADVTDSRFFTYRAHLLLTVGRVAEAAADVERALALAANDPDALALMTLAAVVRNDPERALATARKAVEAAPKAGVPLIALSYAQQARFDLDGARSSLEKAVELEPANALAWARLAELRSARGDLAGTRQAAAKAAVLAPRLARTQTVLGFAHLGRTRIPAAIAAFEAAVAADSADPLPRLGLGLAKIRAGRLHEGARDIEIAASLDPGNAVVRAYLGKAYYEEKRGPLGEREYVTASEADPRDPTPWFYSAIAKQTANRPVEALHDLEKAIELNDNRAVYRSRLMLDADLAARSASLARIYQDLGFQQLALVEGWSSVNADPTSFSAHRFLADSYAVLPRHEIARVSELLQSQLLQPLNITPIQPQLGESSLYLVSSSGPAGLSFNEFNPIFNRNRVVLQPGGMAGSNGLYAGETVISGIQGNVSLSVGYSRFQTDGFRPNADQKDNIANAFVQYEITDNASVQAEYRYRRNERGDLNTRFFPGDYSRGLRITDESNTFRLGGRQAFSPTSMVLASFMYRTLTEPQSDYSPPAPSYGFKDFRTKRDSFSGELQHLFRSKSLKLVSGVAYFDINGQTDATWEKLQPPPPFGPGPVVNHALLDAYTQHLNAHSYAYANPIRSLLLTVGASYDHLTGNSRALPGGAIDRLNPKLAATWNPLPGTSVRAALFRTLKRTLITDQTLEPTQAAGFNQFFDDFNGTDSWTYGGAIDQTVTRNCYVGGEYSQRNLKTPLLDARDPANVVTRRIQGDEQAGRAYLFLTPRTWLALRLEYLYEKLNNEAGDVSDLPLKSTTHRVPMGVLLFSRLGLGIMGNATFFDQRGDFKWEASSTVRSAHSDFWIFDAGVTYRLPRRFGLVALGVRNLSDRRFDYFNTDPNNLLVQPARSVFGRVEAAFP